MTDTSETSIPHASQPPIDTPAGPITANERLDIVDIIRGFALFGILMVNMAFFSAPFEAILIDSGWWHSTPDRVAELAIRTLAEGKFYFIFSMLFGFGMAIQLQRIEARGGRFVGMYVRRLLVLLAFGLTHVMLFWYGDILTIYAIMGFVLLLMRRVSNRALLIIALIVYCLPLLIFSGCATLLEVGRAIPESADELNEAFAQQAEMFRTSAHEAVEIYGSGTWGEIFVRRLSDYTGSMFGLVFMLPIVLSMFLFGLFVGRRGYFHKPDAFLPMYRWLAFLALPIGLVLNATYTATLEIGSRVEPSFLTLFGFGLFTIGQPLLSFGYIAMLVLWHRTATGRKILHPVASMGRMALTNYILQTLICTTLFYSYGFGLFNQIGPAWGLGLAALIWLLQIPLSVFWLRMFRFGPLEWLWRTLTYGKLQPMRRGQPAPAAA